MGTSTHHTCRRPVALLLLAASFPAPLPAAESIVRLPGVEVIETAPLPGTHIPRNEVPAAVHVLDAAQLSDQQPLNAPDFLNTNIPGLTLHQTQGNPFQPDLSYRGYTASPLLGTPQGLSIFVDGVRFNSPFGDTVSWDLIPRNAISTVNMIPGANPLFGLNTLGGALALTTKRGSTAPGFRAEMSAGSWGRVMTEAEFGRKLESTDYFIAVTRFEENGWRDHSRSDLGQLFGQWGYTGAATDLNLTFTYAGSRLNGNGLLPADLLAQRRAQVYTFPDRTDNEAYGFTLNFARQLGNHASLTGAAHYRRIATDAVNVDTNELSDPRCPRVLPAAGGGVGIQRSLSLCERHQDYDGGDPAQAAAAAQREANINTSQTRQGAWGGALQYNLQSALSENRRNVLTLGAAADFGRSDYRRWYQYAQFTRTAERTAADLLSGNPLTDAGGRTLLTNLRSTNDTVSLYASDTYSPADAWHLTLSGRYNRTNLKTADRLAGTPYEARRDAPTPGDPAATEVVTGGLNAGYTYTRFNPAAAFSFTPTRAFTAYASYSEGNRAPTPVELACADRSTPCLLPNAMAADPYLRQVVSKTVEIGARGVLGASLQWSAAAYRGENRDDIIFASAGSGSAGYFTNFGRTRREGLEFALSRKAGIFDWFANLSVIDATFRTDGLLASSNNSSQVRPAADPAALVNPPGQGYEIQVRAGDKLPLVPDRVFKAGFMARFPNRWSAGMTLNYVGTQYLRGNENNRHRSGCFVSSTVPGSALTPAACAVASDDFSASGDGRLHAYIVINANVRFDAGAGWQIFAKVDNLLDRRYETSGFLGESVFPASGGGVFNGDEIKTAFVAPGAPRAVWVGIRYSAK
jgi:iron complex outermembrane receptor protein